jgi:hypothetical protein
MAADLNVHLRGLSVRFRFSCLWIWALQLATLVRLRTCRGSVLLLVRRACRIVCRQVCRHRLQFAWLVLGRADIAVNVVLTYVIDDQLDWLFAVPGVEDHRLVNVDVLLGQVEIIHQQFQVGIFMFRISLAQPNAYGSVVLELAGFIEIELEVAVFPFFLQQHQFIVSLGNGACSSVRAPISSCRVDSIRFPCSSSCPWNFFQRGSSIRWRRLAAVSGRL